MRAKTPQGGQIVLKNNSTMQFGITNRGKDYAAMSKAAIKTEMVDILTSILNMSMEPIQVIDILKKIPIEKMPKVQRETIDYGKQITFSKKVEKSSQKSDCYSFLIEDSCGQILINDGMVIEKIRFRNLKLKAYLSEFANLLFKI